MRNKKPLERGFYREAVKLKRECYSLLVLFLFGSLFLCWHLFSLLDDFPLEHRYSGPTTEQMTDDILGHQHL
jgi:hypothetical protein